MNAKISRRNFMEKTMVASAMVGGFSILNAKGAEKEVKIALVGCGGRGNGAMHNCIEAGKMLGIKIKPVATGDWFLDKAKKCGRKYGVSEKQCFGGADAYKKVLETDAELVLFATAPAFRPIHFEAAVKAGKHCFIEKPVAVDPPGCRQVISAGEEAKKKGLAVVAGTQRRHEAGYRKNAHLIHNGAIGDILNGQVYWLGRVPWIKGRANGQSDADYLVNNWVNWCMMSGDHIVEQHVHNLDVANWFIGRLPKLANGFGGRLKRKTGDQYDFFSVDFDYGEGCHVHSMCRQIQGCYSRVGEVFHGTKGSCSGRIKSNAGLNIEVPNFKGGNGQVLEHYHLLEGMINGKPLNEAEQVATSTLTAIMGRIAAYTGQIIKWDDLMKNNKSKYYNLSLTPTALDFEKGSVVAPKDNVYPMPG
ncbi:hypothetical protein BVX94_01785 [bacterium B17]|nr:hypothetical protein BVX94_01785 [bacterium B17]